MSQTTFPGDISLSQPAALQSAAIQSLGPDLPQFSTIGFDSEATLCLGSTSVAERTLIRRQSSSGPAIVIQPTSRFVFASSTTPSSFSAHVVNRSSYSRLEPDDPPPGRSTAGLRVSREADSDIYILGSAHAQGQSGQLGDIIEDAVGNRRIGFLCNSTSLTDRFPATTDAALIRLTEVPKSACSLPNRPLPAEPEVGGRVCRYSPDGRQHTAIIDQIEFSVDVTSRLHGTIQFRDMFLIKSDDTAFASPGDSGAAVLDAEERVLGIVVAVSTKDRATVCCKISNVLRELSCKLV